MSLQRVPDLVISRPGVEYPRTGPRHLECKVTFHVDTGRGAIAVISRTETGRLLRHLRLDEDAVRALARTAGQPPEPTDVPGVTRAHLWDLGRDRAGAAVELRLDLVAERDSLGAWLEDALGEPATA